MSLGLYESITSILLYLQMNLGDTQFRSAVHFLLFGLN